MKTVKFFALLFLSLIITSALSAQRSTLINGNGQIKTIIRSLENFENVRFEMVVNATLVESEETFIEITADDNVLDRILTEVKGNTLTVDQDGWVEASKTVIVKIGYQDLSSVFNSAWGYALVPEFNGETLSLEAEVGTIEVAGTVQELQAKAKVGKIVATELVAQKARISIYGSGTIKIDVKDSLKIDQMDRGKLVYVTEPPVILGNSNDDAIITTLDKEADLPKAQYIHVTIKNNRYKKTAIRIEGPAEAPFGYGTTLAALGKRKEKFPVGTKIYKENGYSKDDLLLVIESDDANQVVQLFD